MRGSNLPDRLAAELRRDFGLFKERLDRLLGIRGKPGERAVLRDDLALLGEVSEPTSKKVTGTPTDADFNALVDDVHAISRSLTAISKRLVRTG